MERRITTVMSEEAAASINWSDIIGQAISFKSDGEWHRHRTVMTGTSTLRTVMSHFAPDTAFTTVEAKAWLAEAGYKETNINTTVSRLLKEGYIRKSRIGYTFVKPMEELDA